MPKPALTDAAKFIKFTQMHSRDKCWEWTGNISRYGYGMIRHRTHNTSAHRFAYQSYVGPVPDGLVLDHICRNRKCVNPWHLRPMTRVQNLLIGIRTNQFAGVTHCIRGHELTVDNIYWSNGKRNCKTCSIVRARKNYIQRKSQMSDADED